MDFRTEVPDKSKVYSDVRKQESRLLLYNHPFKVPVILEPAKLKGNTLKLSQNKFLIPRMYTYHEFLQHIRRRLNLTKTQGLFVIVGGKSVPAPHHSMLRVYETYKDEDGFLYVTYSSQEVYG